MDTGIGRGIMEIAMALLGIALIALLLNRSSDAAKLVKTGSDAFGGLLNTVMLNNSMPMSSF